MPHLQDCPEHLLGRRNMLMKRNRFLVATAAVALIAGTTVWRVAAQAQIPAATDPLAEWKYPSIGGTQLQFPSMPFQGYQGQTHDPIEQVYAFYHSKSDLGNTGHGNNWQSNAEQTLLVNQTGGTGYVASALYTQRRQPDNALLVIHQPTQTVIVKLSRDAQDKSLTDIVIIADKH